jgi:hypothetical protein
MSGINATPGDAPSEIFYEVVTHVAEGIQEKRYRAWARGPGAETWVLGQAPSGATVAETVIDRQSEKYYEKLWVLRDQDPDSEDDTTFRAAGISRSSFL